MERDGRWRGFGALLRTLYCLLLVAALFWTARGNTEGDALIALRRALVDPAAVLSSWDPSLVSPCTYFRITCNSDNSVIRIDLGNAELSGTLVPQLGMLSQLQYLEMFNNNITGVIPAEIGNLSSLISLDLYSNQFSGLIPSSLGNLSNLKFLRLNENTLEGEIPLALTDLDAMQVLDLSYNDLSGVVPVTGAFARFTPLSFAGNPHLHYPSPTATPAPSFHLHGRELWGTGSAVATMKNGASSPKQLTNAKSLMKAIVALSCIFNIWL